jgi:amino acid adenylation domain-containing protein
VSAASLADSAALAERLGKAIVISCTRGADAFLGISFDSTRFSSTWADILLDCLQHVLTEFLTRTGQLISEISLVSPELQQTYLGAAATITDASGSDFVQDRIEEFSQRDPNRVAATFDGTEMTFRDLNERANQLASHLVSLGSGPETMVAVHLARSHELLISILAILKTGAAFLPLDAALPWKRVETVLQDSAAGIVITSQSLAYRLDDSATLTVTVDDESHDWRHRSTAPVHSNVSENNLAYVIYTSGSTGTPKGVMIEHRNLSAFFLALDQLAGTDPAACKSGVWLAMSSISFDISVVELLWTLSRGFHVVLHRGDGGLPVFSGPGSLPEQMEQYGVTHLLATPMLMRILVSDPAGAAALAGLQMCLVGGEAFPPALASLLVEHIPGKLFNAYGPTEATICTTVSLVEHPSETIPIGRPLANSRLYVVDRWNRLLPPLAPGELLIGGPSVGRGYLGRTELTSRRFISNPFDMQDRNLVYRTGDLVRVNLGGELEFLDRLDSQVKIRGYRIELGEIEAALNRHPQVQQAVVLAVPDVSGEKKLAAYYTTSNGSPIQKSDLRRHLQETLPAYMVPAALSHCPEMPLLSSGKIDRSALAQHAAEERLQVLTSEIVHEPVSNVEALDDESKAIEQNLCAWYGELLKVPQIRSTDDFFELGGESLAAARLMRRISEQYGTEIRLSALIDARTVRALTALIRGENKVEKRSPVVPFRAEGSKPPLFFIAGLGGNVVNFEFVSRRLPDRPVYGVETQGLNSNGEVLSNVEEMASTYLTEICRVQPQGPYSLVGYSFGGILAFEMAQQLRSMGQDVAFLGLLDTAEWRYNRQQLDELSVLNRFGLKYGSTLKQIILGPERRKVLVNRLKATFEQRKLAAMRSAGRHAPASVASVEHRNYFALTQYVPRHYKGELQLFRCTDNSPLRGNDATLGWSKLCSAVTVRPIEGDHESLTASRFAPLLAEQLAQALAVVEGESTIKSGKRKNLSRRDAA